MYHEVSASIYVDDEYIVGTQDANKRICETAADAKYAYSWMYARLEKAGTIMLQKASEYEHEGKYSAYAYFKMPEGWVVRLSSTTYDHADADEYRPDLVAELRNILS